jgi:acetyltransferase-like isoleucine patch superfamily enzyme
MEGGSIVVGNDCLIEGYVVCENKTSQIYIGVSVVTHDVPAWHVVAGNPARVIRKIEECER